MIYREIIGEITMEYEGTPEEINEMLNIMDNKMEEEKVVNNTINYNATVDKEGLIECIAKGMDMYYTRQRQGFSKTTAE